MELSRRSVTGLLAVLLAGCSNGAGPTDAGDGDADADVDTALVALVLASGDEADPPLTLLAIDLDTDQVLATLELPGGSWGDMDASPGGERIAVSVWDEEAPHAVLVAYDDSGLPTFVEQTRVDERMEQVVLGQEGRVYYFGYDEVGYFDARGEVGAERSLVECGADAVYPALTWLVQEPSSGTVLVTTMTDNLSRVYMLDPDDLSCGEAFGLYDYDPDTFNYTPAQLVLAHDGSLGVMRAYWRAGLATVDLSSGDCRYLSPGEWQEPAPVALAARSQDRVVALLATSCDETCDASGICSCEEEGYFRVFSLQQYIIGSDGEIIPDLFSTVPLPCPPALWSDTVPSDWPLSTSSDGQKLIAGCGARAPVDDACPLRVFVTGVRDLPRAVGCGALRDFDRVSDVALIQPGGAR